MFVCRFASGVAAPKPQRGDVGSEGKPESARTRRESVAMVDTYFIAVATVTMIIISAIAVFTGLHICMVCLHQISCDRVYHAPTRRERRASSLQ